MSEEESRYPPGSESLAAGIRLESSQSTMTLIPLPKPFRSDPFPSLEYDIGSKKRPIAIAAITTFVVNGLTSAVIYYILRYATSASRSTLINIIEISATFTVVHWPWRLYLLLRRNGECAPKDRGPLTWDHFQWNFLLGIFQVTLFCVLAGIFESLRWFMFAFVALMGRIALFFILTWILAQKGVRSPIRVSSVPAGSVIRPGIYAIIEDITACDGGGGQAYRERLNVRWESSPLFRKMLMDLTLYSAIGILIQTGLQFVILFATSEEVYVGASTALLWGWFGLTLLWGWKFAEKRLREEKRQWGVTSKVLEA